MSGALLDLFRHNLWANERLLGVCASLPDEALDGTVAGTYGSPRDTLVHLLSAEQRYIFRLRGAGFADALREDQPFPGFDELRRHARRSGEALAQIAAATLPDDHVRVSFEGKAYRTRSAVVLVQVINHGTEHRAHVMTTLTARGTDAIPLDGWAWGDASGGIQPLD